MARVPPPSRKVTAHLAVKDVERSLASYLGVFGPLGVEEAYRFPTDRGTEDVVVQGTR